MGEIVASTPALWEAARRLWESKSEEQFSLFLGKQGKS